MATFSSILAWRIPWTEEPGGLLRRVGETEQLTHTDIYILTYTYTQTYAIGYSSLENPDLCSTPSPPSCPKVAAEKVTEGARTFTPQGGKQPLSYGVSGDDKESLDPTATWE